MEIELIYARSAVARAHRMLDRFEAAGPIGRHQPDEAPAVSDAACKVARQIDKDIKTRGFYDVIVGG